MRFLRLSLLAAALAQDPACVPEGDNLDDTPPEITIIYVTPPRAAHYVDDGEQVSGRIDAAREFKVDVRDDDEEILFLFVARDEESGISTLESDIEVRFICRALVPGGNVNREVTTNFVAHRFLSDGSGEPRVQQHLLNSFNLEDLWKRGNCQRWSGIIDVDRGEITNIQVNYSVRSVNFSERALDRESVSVNGTFTIPNGPVIIED